MPPNTQGQAPQLEGTQDAESAGGPAGAAGNAPNISFDQRGTGFDQPANKGMGMSSSYDNALTNFSFRYASRPAAADSTDSTERGMLFEWANERIAYLKEIDIQMELRERERNRSRFERTASFTYEEAFEKITWETDVRAWKYTRRVVGKRFQELERRVAQNQSDISIVAVIPFDEYMGIGEE